MQPCWRYLQNKNWLLSCRQGKKLGICDEGITSQVGHRNFTLTDLIFFFKYPKQLGEFIFICDGKIGNFRSKNEKMG